MKEDLVSEVVVEMKDKLIENVVLGTITITVYSNKKPDYNFDGDELSGKNLKVVQQHLKKAYSLSKRRVRRGGGADVKEEANGKDE